MLCAEDDKQANKKKKKISAGHFFLFHDGPSAPCSSPAESSAGVLTTSQVFTAPPRPPPPPREHRRHRLGRVAVIYSQRSSPSERPPLARSLAHSPPLPQAALGNVCNGFHPNLGHSVPPRSQQQVSRGRLRWVGFAWQRPAGRPSLFHRARTAARGTTRRACAFERQEAFLCSTCRE